MIEQGASAWDTSCEDFLRSHSTDDTAHDLQHVQRVLHWSLKLSRSEGAEEWVVRPAAWLHDCINLPKNAPHARSASRLSADAAAEFLAQAGYPPCWIPAVHHAIEAHSYSAGVEPATLEARVLQDADRLDALGAIGIARCFSVGGALGRPLFAFHDPFCEARSPDDARYSLDHFFTKLLNLAAKMKTESGREEANRRTAFLRKYLEQLRGEITPAP